MVGQIAQEPSVEKAELLNCSVQFQAGRKSHLDTVQGVVDSPTPAHDSSPAAGLVDTVDTAPARQVGQAEEMARQLPARPQPVQAALAGPPNYSAFPLVGQPGNREKAAPLVGQPGNREKAAPGPGE